MICLLFDRCTEPRYIQALAAESWTRIEHSDNVFSSTASDEKIVDYAVDHGYVVFTRDDDFFKHARGRDCGLLYFAKWHDDPPDKIVAVVKRIQDSYLDHSDIEEGVPGAW